MHVNGDMWGEAAEPLLDVSSLLAHKLRVVAVWIEVCSQGALEVGISIWVVTRQNDDVHFLKEAGSPGWIVIHSTEESQNGLVTSRLVAVD
jgi:hypothetical protein